MFLLFLLKKTILANIFHRILLQFWQFFIYSHRYQKLNALIRTLSLPVLLFGTFSIANANTQNAPVIDEETRLSICTMISQGSLTVAAARQKEIDKAQTIAAINTTINNLKNNGLRPHFVDYIAKVWYADIERLYQKPVLESSEEKAIFAQFIEELSYSECMGKKPNIDL